MRAAYVLQRFMWGNVLLFLLMVTFSTYFYVLELIRFHSEFHQSVRHKGSSIPIEHEGGGRGTKNTTRKWKCDILKQKYLGK
jgi:hypothetical protein